GNTVDGDGCSSSGVVEPGFSCVLATCEPLGGGCAVRVPVTHRDFAQTDADFGYTPDEVDGSGLVPGLVAATLDAEGRPVLADAPGGSAGVDSSASFARWFTGGTEVEGELLLFENGSGGWVNRF